MSQTNLQPDLQGFQQGIKAILEFWTNLMLKNKEDEWKKYCSKAIEAHIGLGGETVWQKVPKEFQKSLEDNLKQNNIPYFIMYSPGGDPAFIVRDTDADAFYIAQCDTYSLSTQFSKELTESSILQSMKSKGLKELSIISVDDPQMGETMKHKLHQCGIVYATHEKPDGTEALIIQSNSKFRKDGKDLVKYEMEHALVQCGVDDVFKKYAPDFLNKRFENNSYDLAVENRFVDMVKNRKEGVLLSRNLNDKHRPGMFIESTKDGVYLHTYNERSHEYDVKKFDGIDAYSNEKDIRAILSYNMENIDDMVVVNKKNFDEFMALNCDIKTLKNAVGNQSRSKWDGANAQMDRFIKTSLRPALNDINNYATRIAALEVANGSIDQKYNAKKKLVVDILENPKNYADIEDLRSLSDFLSGEYSDNKGMTIGLEDKLEMLSDLGGHIDNTAENDRYECRINHNAKISEIEKETNLIFNTKAKLAEAEASKDGGPALDIMED